MPRNAVTVEMNASPETVFDLLHDYGRRLEWDSMLREARLLDGATAGGVGVRTLCVGTWRSAFLPMETEYIRFEPGKVAAVQLTRCPPFFARFAATIKHEAIGESRCRTTYIYNFQARPRWLAPLLEPIIDTLLRRETRMRLRALREFVEFPGFR